MKGLSLYRILTILINIFSVFIALTIISGIGIIASNPALAFGFFILAGVVLYTWFTNKFLSTVIIKRRPFTKRQKDWLQVNAIVAFVFSILSINNSIYILKNPHIFDNLLSQMPITAPAKWLTNISIGLLTFAVILFIHIIWTYLLLRQYKDFIDPES